MPHATPSATRTNEEVRKNGETKTIILGFGLFLILFACFVLLRYYFFKKKFGGTVGVGEDMGDWEVNGVRVHDMKFLKNQ